MKNLFIALIVLCVVTLAFSGEPWAPASGYSSVSQSKTYNRFIFASLSGQLVGWVGAIAETQQFFRKCGKVQPVGRQ